MFKKKTLRHQERKNAAITRLRGRLRKNVNSENVGGGDGIEKTERGEVELSRKNSSVSSINLI